MNQIEIFKGNNGLYGIREINTGEVFIECKYKSIHTIKHHNDLTIVNFDEWFLFFEDNYLDACYGYISNGVVFISKHKYRKLKHFYKGLTCCIQNDEWVIIDSNETVLAKLSDFEPDLSDYESVDYGLLYYIVSYSNERIDKQLFHELLRLFEITTSIESDFYDGFGYHLTRNVLVAEFIPLFQELDFGFDGSNFPQSEEIEKVYEYNPNSGNFLVEKGNNRMALINKYMYQVGDSFDEFFNKDVIGEYISKNYIDFEISHWNKIKNRIDFIGKGGIIYLVEHSGDFIFESLFYPELFCEYSFTKNKIKKVFETDNKYLNVFDERVYHKFDKSFISKIIELERKTNPLFEESDEWITKTLESNADEIFDYQSYSFALPFEWNNDNEVECRNLISNLNSLVGITYSSYKIIGEVGKYDFVNNKPSGKWDEEKLINLLSILD